MAVEYREREGGGPITVLTACPVCGYEFPPTANRGNHFLREHGPEDFGLSPMHAPTP